MLKRTIRVIHNLRVFFLAVIVISFFFYLGVNPISLGQFVGAQFGDAVGMEVSIPQNPFNKLAAQLEEKEERLAQKEKALDKREQALAAEQTGAPKTIIWVLAAGIAVLFVLILVNYYLDWKRRKKDKLHL